MKQVRHRLASCKALPQGGVPPEAPSSIWRQEKPAAVPMEDESEEQLLAGHQELPAALQGQGTALPQAEPDDDFYIQIEFEKAPSGTELSCDGSVMDSSSPEPPQKPHTRSHAPLVLWAGVDQEESKKQRQGEYLRCRRLLMSLEREQVREQQRQKERQRRVTRIKSKKEKQRRAEERRMRVLAERRDPSPGQGASETLAQLRLEERRVKKAAQDKEQRNKEQVRYVEALRAQLREKVKFYHIDLPPLCSCGAEFWDSHPDTCANNCVFYRNHKAYSRALQSLISCQPQPGLPLGALAALGARGGTKRLGSHWCK